MSWIAFSFLEEIRDNLKHQKCQKGAYSHEEDENHHATLGQARKDVQKKHQKLFLEWVYQHALSGIPVDDLFASLVT